MSKKNKGEHVRYRTDRKWWGVAEYVKGRLYWHVSGCTSENEAKVELARRILETGKRSEDDITLGELMAHYLKHKAPTLAKPENALYFHERLEDFWAHRKLEDINQANIRAYHKFADENYAAFQKKQNYAEIKPISNSAVRRFLEHLRACIGLAYRDGIIKTQPYMPLPEKGQAKQRWLTRDEAAKLLREARKLRYARTYLPTFIRIALRTGARKTKILELRGVKIDIDNQLVDYRGNDNKTKRASAAPIFDTQLPYFRALKRNIGLGFVVNKYGSPVKNIDKALKTACINAGLEDVTIHTFRHTFASWLKQDGASVSDVAEALGHTSTVMVDRTYAHMGDGYIQKLRKVGR